MKLSFAKMHGLGNDFMVVDLVIQRAHLECDSIRAWSDRHTGVGFDQLLAVFPSDDPNSDFRCKIFNADGTEAQQCGNGARCVARFVVKCGLTDKHHLALQTAAGIVHTTLLAGGDVGVEMGVPCIEPVRIPFLSPGVAPPYTVELNASGETLEVTPVSMGNPHAVVFVDDVSVAEVARIGADLQRHERFPERVNVGFLQVVDRQFGRLRVFERGVGETRACGSGACAAMVAGILQGRFDASARISLPGGTLQLEWQGPGTSVTLTGPAELVYTGTIESAD